MSACSAEVGPLDRGLDGGWAERVCGVPDGYSAYSPDLDGCTVYRGSILISGGETYPADLTYVRALREVDGDFGFDLGLALRSLEGLERLERVGSFGVTSQPNFEDLAPLTALREVERTLGLSDMPALVSLRGLEGIEVLGENLSLSQLGGLEDLDGLGNLRIVHGRLGISLNPRLRSLSGLERLERVEGAVSITSNPSLPQAEIDAFLARVEIGGPVRVEGNGR